MYTYRYMMCVYGSVMYMYVYGSVMYTSYVYRFLIYVQLQLVSASKHLLLLIVLIVATSHRASGCGAEVCRARLLRLGGFPQKIYAPYPLLTRLENVKISGLSASG